MNIRNGKTQQPKILDVERHVVGKVKSFTFAKDHRLVEFPRYPCFKKHLQVNGYPFPPFFGNNRGEVSADKIEGIVALFLPQNRSPHRLLLIARKFTLK